MNTPASMMKERAELRRQRRMTLVGSLRSIAEGLELGLLTEREALEALAVLFISEA